MWAAHPGRGWAFGLVPFVGAGAVDCGHLGFVEAQVDGELSAMVGDVGECAVGDHDVARAFGEDLIATAELSKSRERYAATLALAPEAAASLSGWCQLSPAGHVPRGKAIPRSTSRAFRRRSLLRLVLGHGCGCLRRMNCVRGLGSTSLLLRQLGPSESGLYKVSFNWGLGVES